MRRGMSMFLGPKGGRIVTQPQRGPGEGNTDFSWKHLSIYFNKEEFAK